MIEKAARPSTTPGGHGRWNSVRPTSNANANYKRLGAANRSVGLMPSSLHQPAPSTAWEQRLTASPLWQPTTPQSYNSSLLQTWRSPQQTPCSHQPTNGSWKLWQSSRQPSRAHLEHLALPTNLFLAITVGLTAIVSATLTRAPHAAARLRVTRTQQRCLTQRAVAKGQGMVHTLNLTVWDGKFSSYRQF
jgi:hypothetical protein